MNFNKLALGVVVVGVLSGSCLCAPQNNPQLNSIQDNKTEQMVGIVKDFLDPQVNGKAADYAQKMRNLCGNNMTPVQKQIVTFLEQKNKPGLFALWSFWKTVQSDKQLFNGLNKEFGNKITKDQIMSAIKRRYA